MLTMIVVAYLVGTEQEYCMTGEDREMVLQEYSLFRQKKCSSALVGGWAVF